MNHNHDHAAMMASTTTASMNPHHEHMMNHTSDMTTLTGGHGMHGMMMMAVSNQHDRNIY
jgi:hypothetical protein